MLSVLGDRRFRLLFLAQVVTQFGTGLATVALGLLAYRLAPESAGSVLGTALAIKMVAYVLVSPLAAAAFAHVDRAAVLAVANLARFAVALFLPFVGEVWQVYLLIFLMQSAAATFTPILQSIVPELLPRERDYTAALSMTRLAYDVEAIASPAVAALLLLFLPADLLFFGTAAGFALGVGLILTARVPRGGAAQVGSFRRRAGRGIRLFLTRPPLRTVLALDLVAAAAGSLVLVLTVVIARSVLGQGESMVAVLLGVSGAGSMAVALTLPRLLASRSEHPIMMTGAALASAATLLAPLALALPGTTAPLVGIGLLWFAIGAGQAAILTPIGQILRRSVEPEDLPAAFAGQFCLSHACWLLAYPLAGWVGTADLTVAALLLGGLALTGLFTAAGLWPGRTADTHPVRACADE